MSIELTVFVDFENVLTNDDSIHSFCSTELQQMDKHSINRQLPLPVSHSRTKSLSNTCLTSHPEHMQETNGQLENILLKNVKLWKQSQSSDNDSVFLDEN